MNARIAEALDKPARDVQPAASALDRRLAPPAAERRIGWALEHLPSVHVLSSSFPVILLDTGYLFAETYRFVDELANRLDLNLKAYRAGLSPARLEARYGALWEAGEAGIERYNHIDKVEPIRRALAELGIGTWFTGLRRSQSRSRANLRFAGYHDGRYKLHPIADWSDRDVWSYLKRHDLPYHPLWHKGYVFRSAIRTRPAAGNLACRM